MHFWRDEQGVHRRLRARPDRYVNDFLSASGGGSPFEVFGYHKPQLNLSSHISAKPFRAKFVHYQKGMIK
jgi:hypothetical protein